MARAFWRLLAQEQCPSLPVLTGPTGVPVASGMNLAMRAAPIGSGARHCKKASWVVDGRLDAPAFLERIVAAIDASPGAPLSGLLEWHAGLKHPRSAIAALARQVDAAAEDGDAIARDLLVQAAGHIAQLVVSVRHAARLPPDASWSFAGGLFASAIFADAVAGKLGTAPVAPAFPPLGGGLLRAARAAGWNISPAWRENVHAGLLARRD